MVRYILSCFAPYIDIQRFRQVDVVFFASGCQYLHCVIFFIASSCSSTIVLILFFVWTSPANPLCVYPVFPTSVLLSFHIQTGSRRSFNTKEITMSKITVFVSDVPSLVRINSELKRHIRWLAAWLKYLDISCQYQRSVFEPM